MNLAIRDIELAPPPVAPVTWWLGGLVVAVLLLALTILWRRRNNRAALALRQVRKLADNPASLAPLAAVLRSIRDHGSVSAETLDSLLRDIDVARFAPAPCSGDVVKGLRHQALQWLQQQAK